MRSNAHQITSPAFEPVRRNGSPPVRPRYKRHFAAIVLALLVLSNLLGFYPIGVPVAVAQDPDEAAPMVPGMIASYQRPDADRPLFQKLDALPGWFLDRGETVDPRLAETGWQCTWRGVLRIYRPGSYRFGAMTTGNVRITIGEQIVASLDGSALENVAPGNDVVPGNDVRLGNNVELAFGFHEIAIEFDAARSPVRLRLFWQSEHFELEPLPSRSIGRRPDQTANDAFDAGQLAVERHACVACHRADPASGVLGRLTAQPGPRLADAGRRLKAAWIYHWLGNAQSLHRGATMPRLFRDDQQGRIERFAVAKFLESCGGPIDPEPDSATRAADFHDGQRLFETIGCIACHRDAEHDLRGLSRKTTAAWLTEFLADPAKTHASGRMPSLNLTPDESRQIAVYLIDREAADRQPGVGRQRVGRQNGKDAEAGHVEPLRIRSAVRAAIANDDLMTLARRVIRERRCAACHDFGPSRDSLNAVELPGGFDTLRQSPFKGCLSNANTSPNTNGDTNTKTPRFGKSLDREAVRVFLRAATTTVSNPAPARDAELTVERLQCLACHQRHGAGGLSSRLQTKLLGNQTIDNAEMVNPPPLTDVADKLLPVEIERVLLHGHRSRPWMALRMPTYPRESVRRLATGLAKSEGIAPQSRDERSLDKQLAEHGRTLAGNDGFGCIKCHDLAGHIRPGSRGPDLAKVPTRIQYAWYRRWLHDPQRIRPRTRMPTFFRSGQSPVAGVLKGNAERQVEALWHYMRNAARMPLPTGMSDDQPPSIADSAGRTRMLRTFLPDTTPRAIAIQFPGNVNLAWDAQQCRPAYAWRNGFLDMRPAWTGRGGKPAKLLGDIVWRGPAGFPWVVTEDDRTIPDFGGRARDVGLGALHVIPPVGEEPVELEDPFVSGERVDFRGYSLRHNRPRFEFDLVLTDGRRVNFSQAIAAVSGDRLVELRHEVRVWGPPEHFVWWQVASADEPPEWFESDGRRGKLDSDRVWASGRSLIRLQQQGGEVVLQCRTAKARWLSEPREDGFALILRIPLRAEVERLSLEITARRPGVEEE